LLIRILFVFFILYLLFAVNARCACINSIFYLLRESDYRILTSPDYPRPYCPNLDCSWRLIAPDNQTKIRFYSDNLDLRLNKDFVNFYNMDDAHPNDRNTNVSYSCTGEGTCEFISSGQYLTIRFQSSRGEPRRYGFLGRATPYAETKSNSITKTRFKILYFPMISIFHLYIVNIR
uniref:CUB domain-containing protein n=1 Tax=Syphacia muris TaxID=451379 RepID=A0A0N5ARF9_9BILA